MAKYPLSEIIRKINLRLGYTSFKNFPRSSTKQVKQIFGNKKLHVVEVGVASGINALNLLQTLNIEKLYLVDTYDRNSTEYRGMPDWESEAKERLKDYADKLVWVKKDSKIAHRLFKDETIDFVYIDGSHLYPNVYKDLVNFYPKVKRGGVFAGHDIIYHTGVMDAVFDFSRLINERIRINVDDWVIVKTTKQKHKR